MKRQNSIRTWMCLGCVLSQMMVGQAAIHLFTNETAWQTAFPTATMISFDDLPAGTVLASQYPEVLFSPADVGVPRVSDGYGSHSGTGLVVAYPDLTEATNGGGDVRMTFATPQGGVSFFHLDSELPGNQVTLYDSADQVLGVFDLPYPHPLAWEFLGFSSTDNNIARLDFAIQGEDFVGLDDLQIGMTSRTSDVLVSNLDEPYRGATPIGNNPNPVDPPEGVGAPWYWAAQSFQTDSSRYQLSSVQAKVGAGSNDPLPDVVAEIRADEGGVIGALITTLISPGMSGSTSLRTFLPTASVELEADTPYWFVLGSAVPGDGTYEFGYANSGLYVGPGALGNFADSTDSGANWRYGDSSFPYFLEVRADKLVRDACDLNSDGSIDAADAGIMFANWGSSGEGDLTLDGIIDAADAGLMFEKWTGDVAPVPEPIGMAWVGVILVLRCRKA